jgi:hypothetical protein
MKDDDTWFFLGFVIVCLVLFGIASIWFQTYKCKTKAVIPEMEWSYGPIQGCMVKQENGKWIDYDRLRYTDD